MPYYVHTGYPIQSAPGASADARNEFDAIAAGFALIAPYSGYGGRIVRINAGGTAQESVTLQTATIESYADAQANTHKNLTNVAGTTTITATATPTLTAYVTNQRFQFPAAGANAGATTIAIDGLAALSLHRPDGSALLANDIQGAGYICEITIRATDAVLNNPYNAAAAVNATNATHASSAATLDNGSSVTGITIDATSKLQGAANQGFAAGTRLAFNQTAAPTGWTQDITINDSLMRIVSTAGGGSGGSQAFSTWNGIAATGAHTLVTGEIPTGLFTLNDPGHAHGMHYTAAYGSGVSAAAYDVSGGAAGWSTASSTTGITLTDHGGNGSHTHPLTNSVKYNDFIVCVKGA